MPVTKLDRAKTALALDHPFFASILMKRKLIPDTTIPTAGVDQRGQMYYNPEFVEKLTVPELVFLLAHEVGHVIGQHASRRGTRKPRKWNIAGDAWINDMLKAANVGQFIKGGVDMPGSKDKTTDQIYNELPDMPDGDGPGGPGDDLLDRGSPITADEADRMDAEIRVELAQAAQAAKMQGKMPAALQKIVAELIDTNTPWYDILERYMVNFTKGDYSWARPNRRYIGSGYYLPSVGNIAKMGEVVIQVDVSGSISPREVAHYNGHLKRILEQCQPERVHVLYTDTRVCKHEVFEQGEEFAIQFYSGGGTDMPAGFKYVDEEGIEPDVFVCLTDMYTDFGSPPDFPVIWCASTDIVAPYGETVPFELES
jgi:predicted metal-dependent peptidase